MHERQTFVASIPSLVNFCTYLARERVELFVTKKMRFFKSCRNRCSVSTMPGITASPRHSTPCMYRQRSVAWMNVESVYHHNQRGGCRWRPSCLLNPIDLAFFRPIRFLFLDSKRAEPHLVQERDRWARPCPLRDRLHPCHRRDPTRRAPN